MMSDVSDQKVPIPNLTITRILNQEKSPDLLSNLGFEAFQPSAECPMIINGKNTPVLDVPLFYFYPLDQFNQENPFEIITRVVQDKKLVIANAFLVLEDFDPPFYEPIFFKEVPSIPENLKTHAEGFCPPVFISSASLGSHSYSDEDVLEKIIFLFDKFAGELTLLKLIPPGIDETDCHPEEEIRLTKRLLYDNSSPRPPKEFVSDNSNADIKSFSPSPIPIKDSDSHMEEIDLSLNPVEPNSRDFTIDVVENISPTKEPQSLNTVPTHPTLQLNMKFQPSSESLFAYAMWIFLPFLVYLVIPCYLLSIRNEDIIFDPGICTSTFSKPDISHRCGTVTKFNTHRSHLNNFPMMLNGKNIPLLDVKCQDIQY
nr:hypothetical protein [Tanacetum cinerariifolium]